MHNFFYKIYTFANARKWPSAVIALVLLLGMGYFALKVSFQENITQLIPSNDKSDITTKVLGQVNFADKISIIISSGKNGGTEDITAYASQFLDSVEVKCKPYVGKVQGRMDEDNLAETLDFVYDNLPIFLDAEDYRKIDRKISPDSIPGIVEGSYKNLMSPTGIVSRDFILRDPAGITFLALDKLRQLSVGDDFELADGFVLTKDRKNLLLFITPKLAANETDKNTAFIAQLESIRKSLNTSFKGKATMSYFGATPVAVANATQIKSDVHFTSLFATITLILLLAYFYRSLSIPFLIFVPSIFGAAFSMAALYFLKGSVSVIALGISSVLLGETTDYSIYVLTHIRNNRNIRLTFKDISKPLILCGVTTAITFMCLLFVKSEALKDLGIFAALSVISTAVFSLLLIPLLYAPGTRKIYTPKLNLLDKLGDHQYHKNKILVIITVVVLLLSLFTFQNVGFNNDLSALNFVPAELRKAEMHLDSIGNAGARSIYLATYGSSHENVLKNNNLLFKTLESEKQTGSIVNFSSIGGIVLPENVQQQKIANWNNFWSGKKARLKLALIASGSAVGFKENTFQDFYATLDKEFKPVSVAEFSKAKTLFLDEFISEKDGFITISTLVKVPAENRDSFVSRIKKQPELVVIDRQQTNETFLGALKTTFRDLLNYSLIAIMLILFVSLRRIELVIVSIIPVMASWIFTTGVMGATGMEFNIINIIVCTLIFGIGVDYSIFMTSALQKQHTTGKLELPTYRTSILLSVATTILGVGVLIFAKHPALKSIALIALIGIMCTLLVTFVLQPLVFNFFVTSRVQKGKPPYEIRRLVHSVLSFIYYGLGGFLLSLTGAFFVKVLPFSRKSKLKAFHYIMSKFMHSVLLSYPSNRKKIVNKSNEKFDKPAVIIANHTSFLDILAVGMLSPKIIFLVSDWVYNSPIFGRGVKLAGFYPVSSGLDSGVEHLRQKVEQGFSLMVFPEGTRSEDNHIKRFHKGAFYLAEQFQLDIVPVVIHGYSEVLPKGDFMINGGTTTVEILPRITPDDKTFGIDYAARTKKLGSYFKSEYRRLRNEIEGPHYFMKMVLNSFDYKEDEVLVPVKRNLKDNADIYYRLGKKLATNANIIHIADDFGELDVLLAVQEPQRKIMTFIADEAKRGVARTNYILKRRRITYIDAISEVENVSYDVMLISSGNIPFIVSQTSLPDTVILLNHPHLKEMFEAAGYETFSEEKGIITFARNERKI
ncbi:MAG TPA: 1-acyl-sn-glycerol-3-phosphate acyltransferase [Flavobacterium sp.]|jgi:1-acyl-sn-glycerol-3-phosphate acyltransferase